VLTTNASGAAEAVRHLASTGHRRIAFLGDHPSIVTAQQRYQGYCDALQTLRIPVDQAIVAHDVGQIDLAERTVTALLVRPDAPTALFTAQNMVTIGAARALRRLGLERSIAMVGFDDFLLADLLSPGLTVVAQDPVAIGRTAATIVFDRIAGDTSPAATHIVPTRLVRRGSGEIPAPID